MLSEVSLLVVSICIAAALWVPVWSDAFPSQAGMIIRFAEGSF